MVDILNTIEYKFADFTEKDMFEIKLKGVVPEFEYISATKRHPFIMFCIRAGFLEFTQATEGHNSYKAVQEFAYSAMGDYRPKKMHIRVDDYLILDSANRPHSVERRRDRASA